MRLYASVTFLASFDYITYLQFLNKTNTLRSLPWPPDRHRETPAHSLTDNETLF